MQEHYARINNVCLIIITAFVITAALMYTRSAMIPFVFAIFIYSVLTPLVNWVQRKAKVPRLAAMTVALGLLVIISTVNTVVVVSSIDSFINGASKYNQVIDSIILQGQDWASQYGYDLGGDKIREVIRGLPILGMAGSLTGQVVNVIGKIFLVFIFTLFMLAGEKPATRNRSQLLEELLKKVSKYIAAKFGLSLTTGVIVWLVLVIFNVELAFIFALLTVMLNFIPTIGSILAVVLPIPILILQFQFGWEFWAVLILTGSTQFAIGNVIEPLIMGDAMDLHPITILLCLIFWGLVWGVAGMFLAVPITAVLKIVFSRLPGTHSFSELLAGRLPESS
jgi:AI-2 transport protein TqsA